MKLQIGFALAMALDCAAFSLQLRYHYFERITAYNAQQASEAAAVWEHDREAYGALLDALRAR